jgi:hypothetical protein
LVIDERVALGPERQYLAVHECRKDADGADVSASGDV